MDTLRALINIPTSFFTFISPVTVAAAYSDATDVVSTTLLLYVDAVPLLLLSVFLLLT